MSVNPLLVHEKLWFHAKRSLPNYDFIASERKHPNFIGMDPLRKLTIVVGTGWHLMLGCLYLELTRFCRCMSLPAP